MLINGQDSGVKPRHGQGREALLAAAIEVVGQKGLRGLTYREVARVGGVTHGLVAHHFGSRQSLIKETLDYAVEVGSNTIQFTSGDIEEFAAELGGLIEETGGLQAFQLELVLEARRDKTLKPAAKAMYDSYIGLIQSDLEQAGLADDEVFARVLMAALDGLVLQQLLREDSAATDEGVEMLREIIKDRIAKHK